MSVLRTMSTIQLLERFERECIAAGAQPQGGARARVIEQTRADVTRIVPALPEHEGRRLVIEATRYVARLSGRRYGGDAA